MRYDHVANDEQPYASSSQCVMGRHIATAAGGHVNSNEKLSSMGPMHSEGDEFEPKGYMHGRAGVGGGSSTTSSSALLRLKLILLALMVQPCDAWSGLQLMMPAWVGSLICFVAFMGGAWLLSTSRPAQSSMQQCLPLLHDWRERSATWGRYRRSEGRPARRMGKVRLVSLRRCSYLGAHAAQRIEPLATALLPRFEVQRYGAPPLHGGSLQGVVRDGNCLWRAAAVLLVGDQSA